MISCAALLASGEESNDAWYLMNLFRQTQHVELLRICHKTLSTFLDLPYGCFANAWPLQSHLEAPTNAAPSSSTSGFIRQRSETRLAPKSKLPPPREAMRVRQSRIHCEEAANHSNWLAQRKVRAGF